MLAGATGLRVDEAQKPQVLKVVRNMIAQAAAPNHLAFVAAFVIVDSCPASRLNQRDTAITTGCSIMQQTPALFPSVSICMSPETSTGPC